MKKNVLLFLLSASSLLATNLLKIKEYYLEKDETKKILVKYASSQKVLSFRWTLYKNDGLVVLSSYDRIVSQHLLYMNHQNQSFRIELKPRGAYESASPYMIIKFDEFDFEKRKAKFSLWLQDRRQEILIKYLKQRG